MKVCTECKIEKDLSEFDKKSNGYISGYCKSCRKEKLKKHYLDNKQYYKDKALRNKDNSVNRYTEYKRQLSCFDCNLSFKEEPYLCDFHHLSKETKEYSIGSLSESFKKFLKEVEKCIPLCSNCHRRRHHKQN